MSAPPRPTTAGQVEGRQDEKGRRKTAGRRDAFELVELDLAILFCLMLRGPAPSCAMLATQLYSDPQTIRAHVIALEKLGLVAVERGGRGLPNVIKTAKNGNPI